MTQNGELDLAEAGRLARWLVDRDNDGLVVAGSTGEGKTLDDNERNALFSAVKEAVGNSAIVIANAGTNSTRESVARVEMAEKAGADAILAVVPYYNKPTQRGMIAHFSRDRRSDEPAGRHLQHSRAHGANMLPATLLDLARRHGNIAGVKESSGDLKQIGMILRDRTTASSCGPATIICSCRAWRSARTASSASRRICARANIGAMVDAYARRQRCRSGAFTCIAVAAHRRALPNDQSHRGEVGDGTDGFSRRRVPLAARRDAGLAGANSCSRMLAAYEPAAAAAR